MEAENVICRICSTEYDLTESIVCCCGERIFLSKELSQQVLELDRKAMTLRAEATMKQVELWQREIRRNASNNSVKKNIKDNDSFWRNVHNKPAWAASGDRRKERREKREEFDLDAFD